MQILDTHGIDYELVHSDGRPAASGQEAVNLDGTPAGGE